MKKFWIIAAAVVSISSSAYADDEDGQDLVIENGSLFTFDTGPLTVPGAVGDGDTVGGAGGIREGVGNEISGGAGGGGVHVIGSNTQGGTGGLGSVGGCAETLCQ